MRKRMLEFGLPFCVGAESVARLRLALGLKREHLSRVIENRSGRLEFCARPLCIGERGKRRRFFPDADVSRNQIGLLEWDVEFRVIGELKRENFLLRFFGGTHLWRRRKHIAPVGCAERLRSANFLQPEKTADAMFEMNNEIAFVQFAKINLRPVAPETLGSLQTSTPMRREPAKQFRRGKNNEIAVRKAKAAGKRA